MKAIILVLFGFLLFLAGCNSVPGTRQCDSNVQCLNEAIASCSRATASLELRGKEVENGIVLVGVLPGSDSSCHISKSISKVHFRKEVLKQYLEELEPPLSLSRENFSSFIDGSIEKYLSLLDSFAAESLPLNACSFNAKKGTIPVSSLKECDEDIEKKTEKLFSHSLLRISKQLELDLKSSEEKLRSFAVTRGDTGEEGYSYIADRAGFFPAGLSHARMLAPRGTSGSIAAIDLNNLSLEYSVTGLPQGSFAVAQVLAFFDQNEKARAFFQYSLENLRSSGTGIEETAGFHGENSVFLKASTLSGQDAYRLVYLEGNWLVLLDVVPNSMDLNRVVEKLESISNSLNQKLNPESKLLKLGCVVSTHKGESCEIVKEPVQHEEIECNQRPFKHKSAVLEGGVFTGLFGGCRAWLKVQVFNQEEKSGSFTLTVNFLGNDGKTVATREESKTISGNSSAQFEVEYSGECREAVKDYNYSVEAPSSEFCETVTKTEWVEKKKCKPSQKQQIRCK